MRFLNQSVAMPLFASGGGVFSNGMILPASQFEALETAKEAYDFSYWTNADDQAIIFGSPKNSQTASLETTQDLIAPFPVCFVARNLFKRSDSYNSEIDKIQSAKKVEPLDVRHTYTGDSLKDIRSNYAMKNFRALALFVSVPILLGIGGLIAKDTRDGKFLLGLSLIFGLFISGMHVFKIWPLEKAHYREFPDILASTVSSDVEKIEEKLAEKLEELEEEELKKGLAKQAIVLGRPYYIEQLTNKLIFKRGVFQNLGSPKEVP